MKKNSTIYIVRKRQIGDVLWIEPIIREYAAKYKKVIVSTKFNVLFENYPLPNVYFKDDLFAFEKLLLTLEIFFHTRFLFVNLDNSYELNPLKHILFAYQNKAGVPEIAGYPQLYLSKAEQEYHAPSRKYAVLHIESFSTKNYRKIYGVNFKEVCEYIKALAYDVILIGKDVEPIEGATYIKTNIREMVSLINKADFFIGIDSGPSHIAASLNIPSLIFFGAINPAYRHFKQFFKGFFLQQPCEFAGCYHTSSKPDTAVCKFVGDKGIPKCSLHSTNYVTTHIDLLIANFCKND